MLEVTQNMAANINTLFYRQIRIICSHELLVCMAHIELNLQTKKYPPYN